MGDSFDGLSRKPGGLQFRSSIEETSGCPNGESEVVCLWGQRMPMQKTILTLFGWLTKHQLIMTQMTPFLNMFFIYAAMCFVFYTCLILVFAIPNLDTKRRCKSAASSPVPPSACHGGSGWRLPARCDRANLGKVAVLLLFRKWTVVLNQAKTIKNVFVSANPVQTTTETMKKCRKTKCKKHHMKYGWQSPNHIGPPLQKTATFSQRLKLLFTSVHSVDPAAVRNWAVTRGCHNSSAAAKPLSIPWKVQLDLTERWGFNAELLKFLMFLSWHYHMTKYDKWFQAKLSEASNYDFLLCHAAFWLNHAEPPAPANIRTHF